MSDGTSWDAEKLASELINTDWDAEFKDHMLMENASREAMSLTQHWMELPAYPSGSHDDVRNGDIIAGVYLRALAKAIGYANPAQMSADNPELADLYREIIYGLISQGVLLTTDETSVIAPKVVVDYIGAVPPGEEM